MCAHLIICVLNRVGWACYTIVCRLKEGSGEIRDATDGVMIDEIGKWYISTHMN